ncbi:hypothetical protein ADL00_41935 [Streptomyces sp. AS58]|nr:hypothetical protein ADL00_41935 [Streptomyces sp. AS58]
MSMMRTQLTAALHKPARLLLTGLAVTVAAFVVFGTVLAQRALEHTILDTHHGTPAAADLVVGNGDLPPSAPAVATVRDVPGVADSTARTSAYLPLRRPAGTGLSVTSDPGKGPLALVHVIKGSYPDAPGEIALTERSASRLDAGIGDTVTVLTGPEADRPASLKVTGVTDAPVGALVQGYDGEQAYAPDSTAISLGGPEVYINQVEVRLDADADEAKVGAALRTVFADAGGGSEVATGAETRREEQQRAVDEYRLLFLIITVFEAVAVLAAMLVATSTFRIVFAQRMRQLALLRAVGADRKPLVRALAAEGALTGAVAGTAGVAVALVVGNVLPGVLGLFGVRMASPGLPLGPALAVLAGAVAMTVVAVLSPAAGAARVSPLEALRSASTTAGQQGISRTRAIGGLVLAGGALALAALAISQLPEPDQPNYDALPVMLLIVFSGALAYFALVALGPVLVRPILRVVGWPLRKAGPIGRLAVGGVGGATRRAAAVSVVVALGVTMIGVLLVGASSVRTTVEGQVAATAPSDFWLSSDEGEPLPPAMVKKAGEAKALTRVLPERSAPVTVGAARQEHLAVDLDLRKLSTWDQLQAGDGSLDDLGPGKAALAEFAAQDAGVGVGDKVTLTRGERSTQVEVVALLAAAPVNAGILTAAADLDRLGVPAGPTGLLADAAASGEQGRTDALQVLNSGIGPKDKVSVRVLADERDDVDSFLRVLVGGALALISLTVAISITGVGSTTALSVVERVREAGLLRAVGLSRRGLSGAMTLEAALYGALGATMGLLLAVPYSVLLLEATGFEATIDFPGFQLIGVLLALTALTALAGVLPARRAARVSPVVALAVDG